MSNKINADIDDAIVSLRSVLKNFSLRRKLYQTLVRGRGLEFESFREYSPQDDASLIDWKASSKSNKLFVKQYREERNQKIIFAVDVGGNMVSGSEEKLKCEYAAEVLGALSHLILGGGERVGFLFFSDKVNQFVLPRAGMKQFSMFIDELTNANSYGGSSNISNVLDFISKHVKETISSVILVSDFISFDDESRKNLSLLSSRYETIALMIKDKLDLTLPDISREVIIEDPKTGQQMIVNPSVAKKLYERNAIEQERKFADVCRNQNVDLLKLMTDKPFASELAMFLKGRTSRK